MEHEAALKQRHVAKHEQHYYDQREPLREVIRNILTIEGRGIIHACAEHKEVRKLLFRLMKEKRHVKKEKKPNDTDDSVLATRVTGFVQGGSPS